MHPFSFPIVRYNRTIALKINNSHGDGDEKTLATTISWKVKTNFDIQSYYYTILGYLGYIFIAIIHLGFTALSFSEHPTGAAGAATGAGNFGSATWERQRPVSDIWMAMLENGQ